MITLRPILSALKRHRSAVAILVVEIALTCAILCNAIQLIHDRIVVTRTPTGIDEPHLAVIKLTPLSKDDDAIAQTKTDIGILRALPDVAAAALVNQLPLTRNSSNNGISLTPDAKDPAAFTNVSNFMLDEGALQTFGARIITGRDFLPEEYVTIHSSADFYAAKPAATIITQDLAAKLWPGESALGKSVYVGSNPVRVVGLIEYLARPGGWAKHRAIQDSMIIPVHSDIGSFGSYLIRVRPGADPAKVLVAAEDALKKDNPRRIIDDTKTYAELRKSFYAQDRSMAWMLSIVTLVLLTVTAFGIVGLASFWVQQRTKQIGVRRALGATRGQILRYFQTENFLIVTGGIVLGMLLAFGINQLLMAKYELPRLPWFYLPIGAMALWLLGQVAVLWPALRAASIPPATATRSV